MTNELRFALVGSGYMAKTHSLALRNLRAFLGPTIPEIRMVRLVDIHPEVAKAGAARWGWATHDTDWRTATRAEEIDAVVIITPNQSHAEIATDALSHGKHVFCEKPLAHTLTDARRLAEAARAAKRVNLVNFAYRCWPAVEYARRLVHAGELGEPLHFEGHFFQDYARDPALPYAWRFDREVAGAGALGDLGSHLFDIAATLMGPVGRLCAKLRRIHPRRPVGSTDAREVTVDDWATSLLEFRSGATGSVHVSWAATGHKSDLSFTLVGTEGSLRFDWERNNELHLYREEPDRRAAGFRRIVLGGIHPEAEPFWYAQGQGLGYGEAFVITARRFVEAILANDLAAEPSFAQAVHVSAIIDAAQRADAEKAWVEVVT